MKKSIFILPFFICACIKSKSIVGNYKSTCVLYGQPETIIQIRENGVFEYVFAQNNEKIIGTWTLDNNIVFLKSEKFSENREDLSPKLKLSNFQGFDKLKLKRKKAYVLNIEGPQHSCFYSK